MTNELGGTVEAAGTVKAGGTVKHVFDELPSEPRRCQPAWKTLVERDVQAQMIPSVPAAIACQ